MSFKLGNTNIGELYVGSNKIAQAYLGSTLVYQSTGPGPGPSLPDNTIRVKFSSGYNPTMGDTQTLIDSTNNIWDIYKESNDWTDLFRNNTSVLEVICANTSNVTNMVTMLNGCSSLTSVQLFDTSNVTNMGGMFTYCSSLTSLPLFDTSKVTKMNNMLNGCYSLTNVPLFDTSKVTNMSQMFYYCRSLTTTPLFDTSSVTDMSRMFYECSSFTTIPLFNTTKVTNMSYMFRNCTNVQSGALALYQQASTQRKPPTSHSQTFYNCGSNTQTGADELWQIPSDWK